MVPRLRSATLRPDDSCNLGIGLQNITSLVTHHPTTMHVLGYSFLLALSNASLSVGNKHADFSCTLAILDNPACLDLPIK